MDFFPFFFAASHPFDPVIFLLFSFLSSKTYAAIVEYINIYIGLICLPLFLLVSVAP